MTTLTVSAKGWVVIPAHLRKKYALTAGDKVQIVDYGGVLALIPMLQEPVEQIRGMLGAGPSLTQALQSEHRQELDRE